MATPSINDYPQYTNKPLTDVDWRNMTQATVNAETDGTKDLTINSLQTTAQITAGTTITAAGNITGSKFYGDGSTLTGLNTINKNWIINGDARVRDVASNYTLVNAVYGTATTENIYGAASGTAVGAGTLGVSTAANCGRSGYAHYFSGVTLTGTGIVYLRARLDSKSAINFINQRASFGCQVYHNVGSTINYTITINKANGVDDFSGVTNIGSAVLAVSTASPTKIVYENLSMGACGNGIEIIISVACGAIVTKNFEFTEMQFELSTTSTTFDYRPYANEVNVASKGKRKIVDYVVTTTGITTLTIPVSSAGLDGNTDFCYDIEVQIICSTTAAGQLWLQPNATVAGNPYSTMIVTASTAGITASLSTANNSGIYMGSMPNGSNIPASYRGVLIQTSGTGSAPTYCGTAVLSNSAGGDVGNANKVDGICYINTNISYLKFVSAAAAGIGTGSRFRIYTYK
jgi:hypothetical protein